VIRVSEFRKLKDLLGKEVIDAEAKKLGTVEDVAFSVEGKCTELWIAEIDLEDMEAEEES
jgi:sporulation protein YlmC with PRC-barrel domain